MSVKVKICGITTLPDAQLALDLGADLLGFNFYPPSPRYIPPPAAAKIISALPPETVVAGVFVNATAAEIAAVLSQCRLNLAQLHGDETNAFCREVAQLGLAVIKAFRLRCQEDISQTAEYDVEAILLDAFRPEVYGGSGHRFDWSWVRQSPHQRVFLAGGITPDNVKQALDVGAYGIDLCSGVEAAPGVKDPAKMRLLFERIACRTERL